MTIKCLVAIDTPEGNGYAEIHVNSLHQLALLMPASVVSYEVRACDECVNSGPVQDAELYDLLVGVLQDIARQAMPEDAKTGNH